MLHVLTKIGQVLGTVLTTTLLLGYSVFNMMFVAEAGPEFMWDWAMVAVLFAWIIIPQIFMFRQLYKWVIGNGK